jgi:hypothetical protein
VAYGICQDQVTARVCVEYFTVGHPPIFGGIEDPTLLAFSWGVIATWWVGVLLGLPAAFLARIGSRPKLAWRDFGVPIALLIFVVAISALAAGLVGHTAASFDRYYFPSQRIEDQLRYVADASAHNAAYATGFVGGLLICGWMWWKRERAERRELHKELGRLRQENRELIDRLSNR